MRSPTADLEPARPGAAARGPVHATERALAPDLARGLMLLLIVTSNTMFFLWAADHDSFGQHGTAETSADAVAQFLMTLVLDVRTYPLFAFLFGYGMAQLYRRQVSAGATEHDAIRLSRRRSVWLLVFGVLHATLLLASDVLGAYGLISLLLGAVFLRRGERSLRRWCVVLAVLLGTILAAGIAYTTALATGAMMPPDDAVSGDPAASSTPVTTGADQESYLAAIPFRLGTWVVLLALTVFGVTTVLAMLLGCWAGRRRVLENTAAHLRLLRWTAVAGIGIGWLGALPAALNTIGAIRVGSVPGVEMPGLLAIQWATGMPGGVGYVALFGLVAHHLSRRSRPSPPVLAIPVLAITAVGKRSLSAYLTHSLLLGPILAAWGLGFGAHLGSATGVLYAFGAWLVTVALAVLLERAGRRGPAEAVLRRLVYRRPTE